VPEYSLKYGKGGVTLSIPSGIDAQALNPRVLPALDNPRNEILRALRNPVGCRPLKEIVRGKKKICLIVSDNTRKCRYPDTLPIFLEEMIKRGGVHPREITILIATGTHRIMSDVELRDHLGDRIVKGFKIVQHDGSNTDSMRRAGRTTRGTVLFYNPLAADSDLILISGAITYHYFAGFTGGRKMVFPGVAANESIIKNHSLSINPDTGDFHDRVKSGSLLGNPVHEDMMEAAGELRPDFLMDVVLNQNGELAAVFAGDFSYAHRYGCQFVEDYFGFVIDGARLKPADLLIASTGGYPRDINLYQVHKSLVNATNLLKPEGGTLILLAECIEGMGHPGFEQWKPLKTSSEIKLKLKHNYAAIGHLVLSLRKRTETHKIYLVSSLPEAEVTAWGMIPVKTISQALGMVFSKLRPPFPSILIMPYASLTTPIGAQERVGVNAKEMQSYFTQGVGEEADEPEVSEDNERSELAKKLFG
jgi:lactate racemase